MVNLRRRWKDNICGWGQTADNQGVVLNSSVTHWALRLTGFPHHTVAMLKSSTCFSPQTLVKHGDIFVLSESDGLSRTSVLSSLSFVHTKERQPSPNCGLISIFVSQELPLSHSSPQCLLFSLVNLLQKILVCVDGSFVASSSPKQRCLGLWSYEGLPGTSVLSNCSFLVLLVVGLFVCLPMLCSVTLPRHTVPFHYKYVSCIIRNFSISASSYCAKPHLKINSVSAVLCVTPCPLPAKQFIGWGWSAAGGVPG